MNKRLIFLIISCFLSLATTQLLADSTNFWQCMSFDGANKSWAAKSDYQISAINQAYATCKKESTIPTSCQTSKEGCEFFIGGQTTKPMWRCTALDQMATPWMSNIYAQRDDAAIAAKAYCQDRSGFPDTCYINLMTCENLNTQD